MGAAKIKRQRAAHLFAAVLAISENDARWFALNPGRSHRLRLAMPEEVAFNATVAQPLPLDPDCVLYVGLRQIRPGLHERRFTQAIPGFDCAGADDAFSAKFFDRMSDTPIQAIDYTSTDAGRESIH